MLKFFTKKEFNHVSISPFSDLHEMYSFGRRFAYYPFWSGLVTESLQKGSFKRFSDAEIIVLIADAPKEEYAESLEYLNNMLAKKRRYRYNYIGVCLSYFNIYRKSKKRYYCSEFVREILQKANAIGVDKLSVITYPNNFLEVDEFKFLYKGKLRDYKEKEKIVCKV